MRSMKGPAILVAMMLVTAGCGARLTKAQLAKAAGSGQNVSAGASGADEGAAVGGDQGTAGGAGSAGGTGGAAGAAGAAAGKSSGGGPAQGAASACGSNGGNTDVGVTADKITLGNVSLLTGPVPGLFRGAVSGTRAFFEYQNSLGGVCGRKLALDARDDQFDANQNKAQYQDLMGKAFGFVGSFSVVDQSGSAVIGSKPDVPDVAYALSKEHFNLPNNFSPQPLPPGWRLGSLNYFKQKFGPDVITKMAIFVENAQSAKDAATGEQKAAESVGYKFVYNRTIEPTEANFSSDVVAMQQRGVKGIMMAGEVGPFVRMAKAMKQLDGRFDAGPAGASIPLPSKLSIFFSSAVTPPRVGLGPAAVRAWTNRRPDSQPKAAKMSGLRPGSTCFSHLLKSCTSGRLSSPAYMASCWSRMAPLVAGAASDVTNAGS